jgi:hypothetical protein
MSLGERLINRRHDLFIRQNLIGMRHPIFTQIDDFFGDQAVAEVELRAKRFLGGLDPDLSARSRS